jgi:site-specific recombinase XerD
MTLRIIRDGRGPGWLTGFIVSLRNEGMSALTLRAYRSDLLHVLAWHKGPDDIERLAEIDLGSYGKAMIKAGHRPATVNRRIAAVRRLCRWAHGTGVMTDDISRDVRRVPLSRDRAPQALLAGEVQALLRAAGASSHGLARRNYALVQLLLHTGIRVSEMAELRIGDLELRDRSGRVRLRHAVDLRERHVPLAATARRALIQYLKERRGGAGSEPLFLSGRASALPVRSIQATIAGLARRARLSRIPVSAQTLRHTFALGYLRDNPGRLAELAELLGQESLDSAALYARSLAATDSARPELPPQDVNRRSDAAAARPKPAGRAKRG